VSFPEIINLLDAVNAQFVVLLCHHNADPDAICSAYAFSSLLRQSRPQITVEVGAAHGISRLSKHLLEHLPVEVKTQPSVEKAQAIVLLDTNTVQQLDDLADRVRNS
jgi:phosphoesterase RecJ-like protein